MRTEVDCHRVLSREAGPGDDPLTGWRWVKRAGVSELLSFRHNRNVNFIWSIADDESRDVYVRGKYPLAGARAALPSLITGSTL